MSNCSRCQFAGNPNESGNVECHRYPPPSYGKTWPLMRPVDWCGEWSQSAAVPDEISSARLTAENEAPRARLETVEAETRERCAKVADKVAESDFARDDEHGTFVIDKGTAAFIAAAIRNLEPRHD